MAGPAPKVIRKLSQHEFFIENVGFGVQRGQDQNAAAKVLMFEYHDKPTETKKRNLDEFVKQVSLAKRANRKLELAGRHAVDNFDVMTSIFLPKDGLLSSPGVLPVYYWFIRSHPEKHHHRIRGFLKTFEERRRGNRQRLQQHPKSSQIDVQLVEFDNYNRSTNDQLSHDGRISILAEQFKKHVVSSR